MPKFALGSDLHLEFNVKRCPWKNTGDAKILLLAGDVCDVSNIRQGNKLVTSTKQWFKDISSEFEYIIWVFGNHEFYGADILTARREYREYLDSLNITNIRILENESLIIDEFEIVGSTLWADFNRANSMVMLQCEGAMNDYSQIRNGTGKLKAHNTLQFNVDSIEYIKSRIAESQYPLVVVTHHQPTFYQINQRSSLLDYAYFNEYFDLIYDNTDKIPVWVSGHIHQKRDVMLENTRLITHCRGYHGCETDTNSFDFKYFTV